jgi:hypothetical protein
MNDWKDYIEEKFVPKEDYEFVQCDKEYKGFIITSIKIIHLRTKTWFKFVNCYGTWTLLDHVGFGNPRTKCHPHIYYPIDFDKTTIEDVNDFLAPAFEGWSIEECYIFFKYIGSRYIIKNTESHFLNYWDFWRKDFFVWEKLGCMTAFLNLFGIINFLLKIKFISNLKRIIIEPINSK